MFPGHKFVYEPVEFKLPEEWLNYLGVTWLSFEFLVRLKGQVVVQAHQFDPQIKMFPVFPQAFTQFPLD